jgi:glycosyltransferase involved in cell wall biosynthesis
VRIAAVHEWVGGYDGSEQVFEAIANTFPDADLFALTQDPKVHLELGDRQITTTFLDRASLRDRRGLTLPLMPLAWRALGKRDYDLVISSHHAFAHANRLSSGGVHLSYVHTPARYVWNPEIDERGDHPWMAPARGVLREADRRITRRVDSYAANSTAVQRRIAQHWGRESRVIHPAVKVEYFSEGRPTAPSRDYVLGFGRWVGYKQLDKVIRVAEVAGLPVKIAGRGPERGRLELAANAATVPVELIESPDDAQLRSLYQNALCLVFPAVEDFGMVPVESMAAGTPVIAVADGGALDTIEDGKTGLLAASDDERELAHLVSLIATINSDACVVSAQRFSLDRFREAILAWVAEYAPGA